jgi:hypothetical protein
MKNLPKKKLLKTEPYKRQKKPQIRVLSGLRFSFSLHIMQNDMIILLYRRKDTYEDQKNDTAGYQPDHGDLRICEKLYEGTRQPEAVGTYLLLGGIGLPVFSGFGGGLGWLLGPGGGFLMGFLAVALGCGLPMKKRWLSVLMGMASMVLCHLLGAAWYACTADVSFGAAALAVSLPYLGKDLLCVWLAELIANKIGFFKKRY